MLATFGAFLIIFDNVLNGKYITDKFGNKDKLEFEKRK